MCYIPLSANSRARNADYGNTTSAAITKNEIEFHALRGPARIFQPIARRRQEKTGILDLSKAKLRGK
jgi:hypothetical protein